MAILRIQHAVPSYDDWKRVFDADPLDRKGSGVQRYEIRRPASDPEYVSDDRPVVRVRRRGRAAARTTP